jgi:hypothetical protein
MLKCVIPRALMGLLMGLSAVLSNGAAGAQQPQLVPQELQLILLIKTTLIAFNHANITGNYTVLRDLASPNFQQANSPARLGEIFGAERAQKTDITPILLLRPSLSRPAAIDGDGRLLVQGFFPSKPKQVNFLLIFEVVANEWRLYALSVHSAEPSTNQIARVQSAEPSANQVVRDHWLMTNTYGTPARR